MSGCFRTSYRPSSSHQTYHLQDGPGRSPSAPYRELHPFQNPVVVPQGRGRRRPQGRLGSMTVGPRHGRIVRARDLRRWRWSHPYYCSAQEGKGPGTGVLVSQGGRRVPGPTPGLVPTPPGSPRQDPATSLGPSRPRSPDVCPVEGPVLTLRTPTSPTTRPRPSPNSSPLPWTRTPRVLPMDGDPVRSSTGPQDLTRHPGT